MDNPAPEHKAAALNFRKLSDVELVAAIRNLRLLLDLHIDEWFRRIEEKQRKTGE